MAKRKTKMISIRVSESEYDSVKSHSASLGVRSVSALAREALQSVLRDPARADADLATQVRILSGRLNSLQGEVLLLTRIVVGDPLIGGQKD
jgi:hypothetical protein